MKHQFTLIITSLLLIALFSFHWADEIARGIESGRITASGGLLILAVWLYGTLGLSHRRSGVVVILLGSLLATGVTILHMQGATGLVGRKIANTNGVFFWVWTLIALGGTGIFTFLLSAYTLLGWSKTTRQSST